MAGLALACGGAEAPDGELALAKSSLARVTTPSPSNIPELGSANRAFAFDLYAQAARGSGNLVLSPYSVSTALAMTYAGARTTTESEIEQTLHFTLEQTPLHEAFNAVDLALASRGVAAAGADGTPFRLNVNNSLWAQADYQIVPAFLDTLALNYGAGVFLTDFASAPEDARAAINGWVADKTERLIPELLHQGDIDTLTRLVLTNTVYFNASWQTKFDEKQTAVGPFTRLDGSTVQAPLMNATLSVLHAAGDGFQAVALPYSSNELSLIAVVPDDFRAFESGLNEAWFSTLQGQLRHGELQVAFPKLDYRAHLSLKPALEALGMRAAFDDADFSGMTPDDVKITDVIHEAVIKVFEGGTIAAGATAVVFGRKSAVANPTVVRFDRPFIYLILDQPTGSILFIGRVLDPTAT